MVGLAYLYGVSGNSTAMLARVEGKEVIVFVGKIGRDPHPVEPSPESGLHLFRKELAGLVLYEITPPTEPRIFDYFLRRQDHQLNGRICRCSLNSLGAPRLRSLLGLSSSLHFFAEENNRQRILIDLLPLAGVLQHFD